MAGRRPSIVWSATAREDLVSIWHYYQGLAGAAVADKMVRQIVAACVLLEQHPLGGRARDEIRPKLRSIAVSPHVIFYRVRNDAAEIVRVIDGRQDLDEIFAQDEK
jgi:toxin ParE1/3/4